MNVAPSRFSWAITRPASTPALIIATLPATVAGPLRPAMLPGMYSTGTPFSARKSSFSSESRLCSKPLAVLM